MRELKEGETQQTHYVKIGEICPSVKIREQKRGVINMILENMNDEMKWLLFRGMVCHLLEKHEYNGNPWLFSGCLDMSFEELS
ncbi:hypothetical protein, partial [Enterobacter asburiae]